MLLRPNLAVGIAPLETPAYSRPFLPAKIAIAYAYKIYLINPTVTMLQLPWSGGSFGYSYHQISDRLYLQP